MTEPESWHSSMVSTTHTQFISLIHQSDKAGELLGITACFLANTIPPTGNPCPNPRRPTHEHRRDTNPKV